MSQLAAEVLLRLAKAAAAAGLGVVVYAVLVGPFGQVGSAELVLLSFLAGAAFVLLVESSPI
jgi:hypothetical protein